MNLWGGRFSSGADEAASGFNSSLPFDHRLYRHDIIGSIAHAEMLGRQGIISPADAEAITTGLSGILVGLENGTLDPTGDPTALAEDIHSFIEGELTKRIGDAGRRLHTGRSRNDQVALDMRMYVKEEIEALQALLRGLVEVLLDTAAQHTATFMPGYTHLQKAQPITLAHHLLAYVQMFHRDHERLADCRRRTDIMPLGSGALATTTYPLDREWVRDKLGFAAISENSLDAVSDRDFCIEYLSALSLIMMHLSRFCEEIILWSTDGFGFVEISDAFATGSSIMPQKKNPDMAELIRGKTGRVYGALTALLTMMKGLPLAYNKDMQEDKEAVFDATDTAKACLGIFTAMFTGLSFHPEAMAQAALGGYMNATDCADWLVKKGVAFRDAHEIIGRLVLYAIEKGRPLEDISLTELQALSPVFDEGAYEALSLKNCVDNRSLPGGPGEMAVLEAIEAARAWLTGNA